jgi:hypothetical protein
MRKRKKHYREDHYAAIKNKISWGWYILSVIALSLLLSLTVPE